MSNSKDFLKEALSRIGPGKSANDFTAVRGRMVAALEVLPLWARSAAELEVIRRTAAAVTSAVYREMQSRMRVKRRNWDRHGPWTVDHDGGVTTEGDGRVLDHHERWVYPDQRSGKNETLYVSEPYVLGHEAIRALAKLIDEGWSVNVTGESPHFPGDTVMVQMAPPKLQKKLPAKPSKARVDD